MSLVKILLRRKLVFSLLLVFVSCKETDKGALKVKTYSETLKQASSPVDFVKNKINTHDLLIFDDALHSAKEPFDFYNDLLEDDTFSQKINFIFIEVFSTSSQKYIDKFLQDEYLNIQTLAPVFQNDYSGYGWRYKTYLDILLKVREINKKQEKKVRVIGVDQPIYWESIHTLEEYKEFQETLIARDYFMYKIILKTLKNFRKNLKGIFITNTRHAYKNIKNKRNELYWNTATFFNHLQKEKTYSIRIHNAILSFQSRKLNSEDNSTDGLSRFTYSWIKMEKGDWDKAFDDNQNIPLGFDLKNTEFGKSKYVGNHMLNAKEGQTMYDAYDGLIFLAPLDELHFSAKMNFFYTKEFKKELKRRIQIVEGSNIKNVLKDENVTTIEEYIDLIVKSEKSKKNSLLNDD